MMRYLLRRLGHALLLLVGVSVLTFLFTALEPFLALLLCVEARN